MKMIKPAKLKSRLHKVHRREQGLNLTMGLLLLCNWIAILFLVVFAIDWLIRLPMFVRMIILVPLLVFPLVKAWRSGWRFFNFCFSSPRTALKVEDHYQNYESLLVSGMELSAPGAVSGTSAGMAAFTVERANEAADQVDAEKVISFKRIGVPGLLGGLLLVFLCVFAALNFPLFKTAATRLFAPWVAIDYPTRTQIEVVDGEWIVKEGGGVNLVANISGEIPDNAKIILRTGKGKPRERDMAITDGVCKYEAQTVFRSFDFRISAGDARSPWQTVRVISAPRIERAEVTLEFPKYTQRPTETVDALTLTVPEGTIIKWKLTLDRAVSKAEFRPAGDAAMPLEVSADERSVTMQQVVTESRAYSFGWIGKENGFAFTSSNNYLQVAPDRAPSVELTSPKRNIYATLGRKLDLAFRGRDDHGIAESLVCYRIDKRQENRLPFAPAKPIDGTEQVIDWDYRTALTNLTVGQTVTFTIELADSYPGENGPHRVRSETRRVQFMSMPDYLAQVEKQKKRLLSQLRTIYREERRVHEVVLSLDRSDPVFVQACQLQAVRQDLMRKRVSQLAGRMHDLTQDLAANGGTDPSVTASLVQLRADLQRISEQHIAEAANALRTLASESNGSGEDNGAAKDRAAHKVNSSARELGLLVLHLGIEDAAEVMAREMHAAAQTQASLRLETIVPGGDTARLAKAQERLGKWLSRLFAASPKGNESNINNALIEFTLTRLVKQLINGGVDTRLQNAAGLIRKGRPVESAKLQSGVIAALLEAEFRLLVGAEREALVNAMDLFVSQQSSQETLRLEIEALDAETFRQRRAELVGAQTALQRNLRLLLMPAVPARRTRLFDDILPSAPAVADLLAAADGAMAKAASHIEAGERDAAGKAQQKAQAAFASLADIGKKRIVDMTQAVRIGRQIYNAGQTKERLAVLGEHQLSLLEKTGDAADDGTESAYLATQGESLAAAVEALRSKLADRISRAVVPSEHSLALPARIAEAVQFMRKAVPLLKDNKPGEATGYQKAAIAALSGAQELLANHGRNVNAYAGMRAQTRSAELPSPYVREIEEEQRDMLAVTRKTKPDDLPALALPQKNLVHAVNAMMVALDPVAHLVESSDTEILFAKEDMDTAGISLTEKDPEEVLDAQEFIVESLENLRGKIEAIVPQHRYLLEVVEALHETLQEGILIREGQRRLGEQALAKAAEPALLSKQQGALKARAEAYGKLINEISGLVIYVSSTAHMAEAEDRLKAGDAAAAALAMVQAEEALEADTGTLLTLMKHLRLLLLDPKWPGFVQPDEVVLAREVIVMAAQQKRTYREISAAKPDQLSGYEAKLREFEMACSPFIERAKQHKNPVVLGAPKVETLEPIPPANLHLKLVDTKDHLGKAAAGAKASDRAKALASQKKATEILRHFICEYALKFAVVSPPLDEGDSPEPEWKETEDMLVLFARGVLTGKRPPDGKLEWEVLGRRDRASLNENFARELPLEYRAILKDYYERLAK